MNSCAVLLFVQYTMNGEVKKGNGSMLVGDSQLLGANGWSGQLSKLLLVDDTALVACTKKKLYQLVSEICSVCEMRKLLGRLV